MKRPVTNREVINKWLRGEPACNHRRTLTASPTGGLFSYDLKIGQRAGSTAVVVNYTATSRNFHSQTTSCHVNLAARGEPAGCVWHPEVWCVSPLGQAH